MCRGYFRYCTVTRTTRATVKPFVTVLRPNTIKSYVPAAKIELVTVRLNPEVLNRAFPKYDPMSGREDP